MRFEFDISPVEQARPRATRMGKGIRLYDPKKVTVFKRKLGILAKQQMLAVYAWCEMKEWLE